MAKYVAVDLPLEEIHRVGIVGMGTYDTIGGRESEWGAAEDWYCDWDELLYYRSTYEFIREDLTPEQQKELDEIDAYWRERPKQFNDAFANTHWREDKKTAMQGWIRDEAGKTPAIPRSHWWWWSLNEDKDR